MSKMVLEGGTLREIIDFLSGTLHVGMRIVFGGYGVLMLAPSLVGRGGGNANESGKKEKSKE